MIVYNVLFKGVEQDVTPTVRPFVKFEMAEKFCELDAQSRRLKIRSTSGFTSGDENTVGSFVDFRCEDGAGNSYYYIIFVQELKGVYKYEE